MRCYSLMCLTIAVGRCHKNLLRKIRDSQSANRDSVHDSQFETRDSAYSSLDKSGASRVWCRTVTLCGNLPNLLASDVSEETNGIPASPTESADTLLVLAARKGDRTAFEDLVRRYQQQATAVAFRLLSNRDDAMEIVQDAFLNAFDRLGSLEETGRFGPWLLRIVNNLSLNRRRSRALRKTASLEMSSEDDERGAMNRPDTRQASPPETVEGEETKRMLAQAIAELPEMQRQALILFSIRDLPQKEVAEKLGCSVEAVKWHVFTARKKLKEKLKNHL